MTDQEWRKTLESNYTFLIFCHLDHKIPIMKGEISAKEMEEKISNLKQKKTLFILKPIL